MALPKPSGQIDWVSDEDPGKTDEPGAAKKALGFVAGEKPSFKFHNWLWARIGNWQKYFESVTDELVLLNTGLNYDRIVNTGDPSFDPDLQTAIDNASSGDRILVMLNQVVTTRISVAKSDLEIDFKPGIEVSNGVGDTVGIEVAAARVKINNGRFVGWTGGSDIAVNYTAAATYGGLMNPNFVVSTNTTVDDSAVAAGKKPYVIGQTQEV